MAASNGADVIHIKMTVVGDSGVGKSTLCHWCHSNSFQVEELPTRIDVGTMDIRIGNQLIQLSVYDTSGRKEYDRLRPLSYPTNCVSLVSFSIDNCESFENVKAKWIPEMKHHVPDVPIVVAGLKRELRERKQDCVTQKEGNKMLKEEGVAAYVECSPRLWQNVDELYSVCAKVGLHWLKTGHHRGYDRCNGCQVL